MSKQDYYLLVSRRYIQGLLVLVCIYMSLPIIFSGYDHLEVFQIYFKGMKTGNLGFLFSNIGFGYVMILFLKVFFRAIYNKPINDTRCFYIFRQIKKIWLYYLITGVIGYCDDFYVGDISISPLLDLILLMIFTALTYRVYQVYDQSIITNYQLAKKQTMLKYLKFVGSKKISDDLIMTTRGNILIENIFYYYHIKHTPFTLIVSKDSSRIASFYRCILNLVFSFIIFCLSINGMIEENNFLRYTGLILMSLLLAFIEIPTLYEIIKNVKKRCFEYRKKGKE